jgi:hypothetical protein
LAGRHVSRQPRREGRSYAIAAVTAAVLILLARLLMAVAA